MFQKNFADVNMNVIGDFQRNIDYIIDAFNFFS